MRFPGLFLGESARGESPSGPPLALLALGWLALLLGGLRSETLWLAWSGLFWLLVWWSPPDGPTLFRADLWLAWTGWLLLSSLWSLEPLYSLSFFWRRATMVLFFSLASSWWGPRERRAWAVSLFALAAAFAAFWAWGYKTGRAPDGLLPPNSNYTGCLLGAACGAAFWCLAPAGAARGRRLAGLVFIGALLAVLVWMRSRGAALAFACSAGLWCAFHRSLKGALAGAALAAALLLAAPASSLPWFLKLGDPLSYQRPKLWMTAVRIADSHPWLGVGPGCFERAYFRFRGPALEGGALARYSRYTSHAHSEPLHLAAETGWLGLAFMVWALGLFLPGPRPASFASRAAQGAFWALLAHGFVDGVLALPGLELLFFGALACAGEPEPPPFRFGPSRWRWLGLAGLAIAFFTWLPAQRAKDAALQASVRGAESDLPTRALDGLRSLLGRGPSRRARMLALGLGDPRQAGLRTEYLKEALAVRPQDSFLHYKLAEVYATQAPPRIALALWELDRAIASNPTYARFQVQKAQLLLTAGDLAAAREAARSALELEPNFAYAALIAGEASAGLGDPRAAQDCLQRIERGRQAGFKPASDYERLLLELPEARWEALRAKVRRR